MDRMSAGSAIRGPTPPGPNCGPDQERATRQVIRSNVQAMLASTAGHLIVSAGAAWFVFARDQVLGTTD
jgi:hypothetical protein